MGHDSTGAPDDDAKMDGFMAERADEFALPLIEAAHGGAAMEDSDWAVIRGALLWYWTPDRAHEILTSYHGAARRLLSLPRDRELGPGDTTIRLYAIRALDAARIRGDL